MIERVGMTGIGSYECDAAASHDRPLSDGRDQGAAAHVPMRVAARASAVAVAGLCAAISALLLAAAPALAAAPEAPATSSPAQSVTNTTARLEGIVNPGSSARVSWYFEYDAGPSCTGAGASRTRVEPAEGTREVERAAVDAIASNLQPAAEYTFCLVVENGEGETAGGKPVSFTTTASKPNVSEESVADVTASEATVSAQLDAAGSSTTFWAEYGTSEPYSSSATTSIGAPEAPIGVSAHLTGLKPSSTYHFRFLANSGFGTATGAEVTFVTDAPASPSSLTLPDDREYELVSPLLGDQEVYSLDSGDGNSGDVTTILPVRASANGEAVVYAGDPPVSVDEGNGETGNGSGNTYMATRGPAGWTVDDLMPSSIGGQYRSFSSDLSVGILGYEDSPPEFPALTAEVSEDTNLVGCRVLYSRNAGQHTYRALFTTTQTPGFCGEEYEPVLAGANAGTSSVPGYSRLLFQTRAALIPGVEEAAGAGEDDLYESVEGHLSAVNVLEGKPDPNATFGAPTEVLEPPRFDFSNVISADGSRVFWTDLNTGRVYVREDGTSTVAVSAGPATFMTATPDGRYAFYSENEQLWRFDLEGEAGHERQLLAHEGPGHENAGVQGVIGVSEDGEYVYFVATGRLASSENDNHETASAGQPNLYVSVHGLTKFIATLSVEDNNFRRAYASEEDILGDWQASLATRTAEVTPGGHVVAFLSRQALTGYDNVQHEGTTTVHAPELFVYDADTAQIVCASCDPSGAPPPFFRRELDGAFVPVSFSNLYMQRWLSEDGDRVFFDTNEPLVPQDTNKLQDVYEWERNGTGSCASVAAGEPERGCIYLLTAGTGNDDSSLLDASADGDDVFFTTRTALIPGDESDKFNLYDARVGGGFPQTSLACTGTGCQGVPPGPPTFATPASVTFDGVGNFPPPAGATTKTVAEVRAEHLAKALKACRAKHNRHRRVACEAQARKRYGPEQRIKTSKKPSSARKASDKRGAR